MRLTLKTKITIGVLFLFGMLLLVGSLGIYYLMRLNKDAREILKDNYESLDFSKNMLLAMEQFKTDTLHAYQVFNSNLQKQENNITEPGEGAYTDTLRFHFNALRQNPRSALNHLYPIKWSIYGIIELNMRAIVRKSEITKKRADRALIYISMIAGICFLISFTFVINFPEYIAHPIRELSKGIREISNKNYSHRLYFKTGDEFEELAVTYNAMAQKLDEYENSNLAKILFEKRRVEAVINSLQDPAIGMDTKGIILFANQQMLKLSNLRENEIVGKKATEISEQNDLLRFLLQQDKSAPFKIVIDGKENFFSAKNFLLVIRSNN